MHSPRATLCAWAFLGFLHPAALPAQAALVDSLVRHDMQVRRIPGVAIAVVENGRVTLERAWGVANLETETPLATDAVFELASITKQVTAAAVMLLVEAGQVVLDTPITVYVDSTPPHWSGITVRHLLNHTAGLDIGAVPRHEGSAPLTISTRAAFSFITQQPAHSPPGRDGWYSDAGYFLLGMIIERASGQPYRRFLQERIFDPLEMTRSSVLDKARILKGRVPTYSMREGELVHWRRDWDYELPSFFGIFSTLGDLVKWDAALRDTTLLSRASLAQMWTPGRLDNGHAARVLDHFYGMGLELSDLRGHRTVGHGGASGTYLLRFLDQPLTVIVLTNLDSPSGRRHAPRLARAVAGAVRPALTPPEALAPRADPAPQITRGIDTLLADIAANRRPALFSDAYAGWWATALGRRAVARNQLRGVGPVSYVASDEVAGRTLWDADPLVRLIYYRATAGDRTLQLTVGLTREGKVGRLDMPLQ
jgi:CubicO group peptidase (beta-lactamase class C family)